MNRDELKNKMAELTTNGQILFSLLCAERLQATCWAFGKKEDWDVSKYYEGCDLLFNHIAGNTELSNKQGAEILEDIDAIIPNSDDFGYFLQVQAQSGMIALLYAFESFQNVNPENGVFAAYAVIDGVENYKSYIQEKLTGNMETPDQYHLMKRELNWQEESIKMIRSLETTELPDYISLRVLNAEYAIPVAVSSDA